MNMQTVLSKDDIRHQVGRLFQQLASSDVDMGAVRRHTLFLIDCYLSLHVRPPNYQERYWLDIAMESFDKSVYSDGDTTRNQIARSLAAIDEALDASAETAPMLRPHSDLDPLGNRVS